MAKTAAADAAVYRQQIIEDLWYVAGDVGLVTMLGTTSVQATLARAFDGVAAWSLAVSSMTNADLDRKIIEQEARQGDLMLRAVYEFLGRFVLYPSEHAQTAHTLWCVHTHLMHLWDTTPRLAFLSPEPGVREIACARSHGAASAERGDGRESPSARTRCQSRQTRS